MFLQAQTEVRSSVSLNVLLLQVVQEVSPLTYHLEQASSGVVVLLVDLQVLVQIVDPGGQDGDLDFRRTGVSFFGCVLRVEMDIGLLFSCDKVSSASSRS